MREPDDDRPLQPPVLNRPKGIPPGGEDLIDNILAFECLGARVGSLNSYRSVLGKFLITTAKTSGWTRDEVLAYFAKQLKTGTSKGYVRFQYTVLLALWRHLGMTSPISRRDLPPIRREDQQRPVASKEDMRRLCRYAKTIEDEGLRSVVVASTIWGLRRTELFTFQVKGPKLLVATAKTGSLREHFIPPEISSLVVSPPHLTMSEATHTFHRIRIAAGIKKQPQQGWHWIRRSLATGLLQAGVPMPVVSSYMGWNPPSSVSAAWYFTPDPGETDGQVYLKHPFLSLWD